MILKKDVGLLCKINCNDCTCVVTEEQIRGILAALLAVEEYENHWCVDCESISSCKISDQLKDKSLILRRKVFEELL